MCRSLDDRILRPQIWQYDIKAAVPASFPEKMERKKAALFLLKSAVVFRGGKHAHLHNDKDVHDDTRAWMTQESAGYRMTARIGG